MGKSEKNDWSSRDLSFLEYPTLTDLRQLGDPILLPQTPKPRSGKAWIAALAAGAVVLTGLALLAIPAPAPEPAEPVGIPGPETEATDWMPESEAAEPAVTFREEPTADLPLSENLVLRNYDPDGAGDFVFGTELRKDQVESITFLSSLAEAPASGTDVSETGMGGVLLWTVPGTGELFIAGDGPVQLPQNSACLFEGYENLTAIDFGHAVDTRQVRNMQGMFLNCNRLKSLDLTDFDTGNVTSMEGMFQFCWGLTSLKLTGLDTGSVTDMSSMFTSCSRLTDLDLSGFNTGRVTDMSNMFHGSDHLQALDLSSFDTGSVTDMTGMFEWCRELQHLELGSFDTASVTGMGSMFYGCGRLEALDLSGFDTGSVNSMFCMFRECRELKRLDLGGFTVGGGTDLRRMFYDCSPELELIARDSSLRQQLEADLRQSAEDAG